MVILAHLVKKVGLDRQELRDRWEYLVQLDPWVKKDQLYVNGKIPAPREDRNVEQEKKKEEEATTPALQKIEPSSSMVVEETFTNNENGGYYNRKLKKRKRARRLRQH
ncbi:hypothetical protein COOONC_24499 [Cooperia oncophora]